MDLFCPHCTRRVTVGDDKAGLVVNCPLCSKPFMAPSLAPPPPPPPAPPTSFEVGPPPPKPASDPQPKAEPTPPPAPPGDYTGSLVLHLRGRVLPFVPAVCLVVIFVLSFFDWHHANTRVSMWGLAGSYAPMLIYTVLLFPTLLLAIGSCVLEKNLIALPPAAAPVVRWKDLLLTGLLTLGLLMLAFDYV